MGILTNIGQLKLDLVLAAYRLVGPLGQLDANSTACRFTFLVIILAGQSHISISWRRRNVRT